MFGNILKIVFDSQVALGGIKRGEVDLFTYLKRSFDILATQYKNYQVDIIHSRPSMTTYEILKQDLLGCTNATYTKKSELGDLMFIVYSPTKKTARLSVIQNKYEKSGNPKCSKFKLDACQWYLMQGRAINVKCPLKFVTDSILKDKTQPPLCGYGVFYKNNNCPKDIEMFYTPIDLVDVTLPLKLNGNKISANKTGFYKGTGCRVRQVSPKSQQDVTGLCTIADFGDCLVDCMLIGKPINTILQKNICSSLPNAPKSFRDLELVSTEIIQYTNDELIADIRDYDFVKGDLKIVFINSDNVEDGD